MRVLRTSECPGAGEESPNMRSSGRNWRTRAWTGLVVLTETARLVLSYRDMFRNVGYRLKSEESIRGVKDEVEFEVLISLFANPD